MSGGVPAEPARLCLLGSLPRAHASRPPRVRFVGRVAGLLPEAALAVLVDSEPTRSLAQTSSSSSSAVLIDLTLPVLQGGRAPPRLKDRIMITGEVTRLQVPIAAVPELQVTLPAPVTTPLDLRTVITVEQFEACEDLDMEQWRAAIRAVDAVRRNDA
ncbi:hypothetical protein BMF94_0109 [Rhodotorula taiwanensis]|uniref:CST complex subunit Stn1 N-terminal domain-containing protein n=1 Tax=Rhodotorula taiwanensis TaxID=741276 RepID=A0A2S5BJA8_9BASI|nr:hypothetical protein BMF94_0109 [Rhodotorula taiwanensis]